MPVISVRPSFESMLRARFSRPPRPCQSATFPSPWRIQRHLLHDKKVEGNSGPIAQDKPSSKTLTNGNDSRQSLSADLDIKARIWEWTKQASISLRHRADDFTAKSKSTFSQLGSWLNQMTGYEEIEALKKGVVKQEERIDACRQAARKAKQAYNEALVQRASSQREVNDLLQRKTTWTGIDVARFTELVPQDHHLHQEEARMKAAVDEADDTVEKEFSQLMRLILARYHEEQIWSDKIRSASTYGSLVALGLNMIVFISAILVVEPWKRRRLVQTFEDKISELSATNATRFQESMGLLGGQMEEQKRLVREWKEENSRRAEDIGLSTLALDKEKEKVEGHIVNIQGMQLSKRHLEVAALTSGAFVAGILTSILITR